MKRMRPSKFEIFRRPAPDEWRFTIAPPLPVTRDIPLSERLAAYKQAKRLAHNTRDP